jgi:hypothetical protein
MYPSSIFLHVRPHFAMFGLPCQVARGWTPSVVTLEFGINSPSNLLRRGGFLHVERPMDVRTERFITKGPDMVFQWWAVSAASRYHSNPNENG